MISHPRRRGTDGDSTSDRARHGRLARHRPGDGRRFRGRRLAGGGRDARPGGRHGRPRAPRRAPRRDGPLERPRCGRHGASGRRWPACLRGEQRGLGPLRGGGGRGPRPRPARVRDQPLRRRRGHPGGAPGDAPGRLRGRRGRLLPLRSDSRAALRHVQRVEAGARGGPRGAGARARPGRRTGGADRGGRGADRARSLHDRERDGRRARVALRRGQGRRPRDVPRDPRGVWARGARGRRRDRRRRRGRRGALPHRAGRSAPRRDGPGRRGRRPSATPRPAGCSASRPPCAPGGRDERARRGGAPRQGGRGRGHRRAHRPGVRRRERRARPDRVGRHGQDDPPAGGRGPRRPRRGRRAGPSGAGDRERGGARLRRSARAGAAGGRPHPPAARAAGAGAGGRPRAGARGGHRSVQRVGRDPRHPRSGRRRRPPSRGRQRPPLARPAVGSGDPVRRTAVVARGDRDAARRAAGGPGPRGPGGHRPHRGDAARAARVRAPRPARRRPRVERRGRGGPLHRHGRESARDRRGDPQPRRRR